MPNPLPPVLCPFCRESLEPLYARLRLDVIDRCPRCEAAVTFTTDLSDVRSLLAQVVYGERLPTDAQMARMRVVVMMGIDTLLDEEGGEVVDEVHLAAAWDPDELLSTAQVARIAGYGGTRQVVTAISRGKFPGAVKSGDEWRIPRRDVGR